METLEDRTLLTVHLLANFKGLDTNDAGGIVEPPDTIAAAGPTAIVEVVNSNLAYYDKTTGSRLFTESLSTFFAPVDTVQSLFSDVYVTYDELAGRFFVSTMDIDFFNSQSYFDFAVSNDSDPTHGFTEMHQINTTQTSAQTGETLFTDFPRIGWNADAYVISFNMFGFLTGYQYNVQLLTINKASVLDKNNATLTTYGVDRPLPNSTMVPATMHGAATGGPLWFVEEKGLEQDGQYVNLRVVQMTNVLSSTPTFTDYYVGVAPYTITPFPGDTLGQVSTVLDTRILSVDWRNNQMAVAQDVGIPSDTNVHAAWYLLSTSGSAPSLAQQGTISPGAGIDTYMPSVALGTDGSMGMTYIESSATEDMAMYVTGRRAADGAGTMQRAVLVKAGEQYYQGTRIGDFSGISVDPSSGTTYWAANEYAISTTDISLPNWGTWIGKFNIVGPSQLPTSNAGATPSSSNHSHLSVSAVAPSSRIRDAAARNIASMANGKLATNSSHPLLDYRSARAGVASASPGSGNARHQSPSLGNGGTLGGGGRFGPRNPLLVSQVSNFKGLDTNDAGGIVEPPDTIAAAGPTAIVEIVNSNIAYYDKTTGSRIFTESLSTFFAPVDTVQSLFSDVYVTYDESVGRFFVSTMDIDFFGIQSYFDFAVSNDSDPTHGFTEMHQINTTETSSQTGEPLFTDFPRVGWNADAYVISFNMFGFLTQYPYNVQLLTINKASVTDKNNNTLTTYQVDRPLPNSTMVPATMHGATAGGPLWFVEEKGLEQDGQYINLRVVEMTNVLSSTPTFTDFYVTVAAYTITPFPGDTLGQVSFVLDTRILSVDWRSNQMVIAQDVGVSTDTNVHAGWYLVSTSGSAPSLVQQGALAPAVGTDTYMPSAALGTDGSIGMTYIESSPTENMSMYVTGRLATDPAGTMQTGVLVKAGEQYYQGTRIGDFSGISVDPNSGTTYWAANEYAISTTDISLPNWGTWIGQFTLGTTAANTTTTVTSDHSSGSVYGQVVTFTATVSPVPPASGTPTGTVQFQIDGTNFGNPATLSGGSASISTGSLAAGSHTVAAIYSGDSNFLSSTGTLGGGQSVNAAPLTITADNQSMTYGGTLPTLTATYTGLVNGDTPATFTISPNTPPVLSTVPATSHAGNYTISVTGAYDPNYTISYGAGTLTINPAPLTITADNQSMVYGGILPTLTASYTGLVNGDTAATFNISPNVPPTLSTVSATSPVGSYVISVSGAVDPDYTISFVNGTLTITAASLTITADNQSMTYGGTLPTLTATYTGLVNGDTPTTFTISPNTPPVLSTVPATSHAGSYTISVSGAYDPNYTITYVAGTLTINPALLTITADNQSMVYGGALPTLTATFTGLVNGDAPATFNISPNVPPTLSTVPATSPVGSYVISVSGAVDSDYTISFVNGTLTITAASLIITADNQSMVYGGTLPTLTATYTGLVNGDTPATFTVSPNTPPVLSTVPATSHAGSYTITVSGAYDPNYTISYVSGTLTITPAPLTIAADNQSMVYGGTLPTLTATFTGLVNGDTPATFNTSPNVPPSLSTVPATSPVGSYVITVSGASDSDYTISYVNGTLTITAAALVITADNQTMVYGGTLPTLTASYSGLVNGDTPATFTISPNTPPVLSTVPATSHAGSYTIAVSGAYDPNYTISYVSGTLTITSAPLTITADNQSMVYGGTLPTLTATFNGLVNGDTPATFNASPNVPPSLSTVPATSHAGSYAITVSGAVDPDYTISYVNGTLTITPAPLVITADNQSRVYGAPNPTFTASYSGFVNGDTPASLTTPPSFTTTATVSSLVGTYPITVSGATDPDYTITFVSGTLTIVQDASTTLGSPSANPSYFGQTLTLTATITANAPGSGTPTGTVDFFDTTTATDLGTVTLSNGSASLSMATLPPGSQTITLSYSGDVNFLASAGTLTATVVPSVYVLDPTSNAALGLGGSASIQIGGLVQVDSSSGSALVVQSSAQVQAGSIQVVGGYHASSQATLSPTPITGVASVPDPLAGLPVPSVSVMRGVVNLTAGSLTINPGIYLQISVSGTGSLTLNPGIYVIAGGGLAVTSTASISGTGVLIYNAGSNYVGHGSSFGSITLTGQGTISLTPAGTGPYAGIAVFQSRDNTRAARLNAGAVQALAGSIFYAPAATVSASGNASLVNTFVVDRLQMTGGSISFRPTSATPSIGQPSSAGDSVLGGIGTPLTAGQALVLEASASSSSLHSRGAGAFEGTFSIVADRAMLPAAAAAQPSRVNLCQELAHSALPSDKKSHSSRLIDQLFAQSVETVPFWTAQE